jgi:histidinol dehydrogenase
MRLDARAADFEARFAVLLAARSEAAAAIEPVVAAILADVKARGDAALAEYTLRLDGHSQELPIGAAEIDAAVAAAPKALLQALALARDRIADYHRRQMPRDERHVDALGVELGWRWTPIAAIGIYVPGGIASYPSSVLMNAVPARVAGVRRIVMATPSPAGALNPLVLAAARIAGVDEIFRIGGAQAVAALAYGTATIAPVEKIVGPGNAYVAAAKRQVFGTVGIDTMAGPSEVLIVADADNDAEWLAADLLAQAEHDPLAQAVLITDDAALAEAVDAAVARQLKALPRREIAAASWRDFGAIIVVPELAAAPALVDRIAPEHLELAVADPETLSAKIANAGAVFLGRHSPEAIGDYVAGPSHVLPTAGSARFASGLSVQDFLKRTSLLKLDEKSLRRLAPAAIALAEAEGLGAHARSITIRLGR